MKTSFPIWLPQAQFNREGSHGLALDLLRHLDLEGSNHVSGGEAEKGHHGVLLGHPLWHDWLRCLRLRIGQIHGQSGEGRRHRAPHARVALHDLVECLGLYMSQGSPIPVAGVTLEQPAGEVGIPQRQDRHFLRRVEGKVETLVDDRQRLGLRSEQGVSDGRRDYLIAQVGDRIVNVDVDRCSHSIVQEPGKGRRCALVRGHRIDRIPEVHPPAEVGRRVSKVGRELVHVEPRVRQWAADGHHSGHLDLRGQATEQVCGDDGSQTVRHDHEWPIGGHVLEDPVQHVRADVALGEVVGRLRE